jgi:hypothetical protein
MIDDNRQRREEKASIGAGERREVRDSQKRSESENSLLFTNIYIYISQGDQRPRDQHGQRLGTNTENEMTQANGPGNGPEMTRKMAETDPNQSPDRNLHNEARLRGTGPAQPGPAWPGPAQPGPAWPGPARPGPAHPAPRTLSSSRAGWSGRNVTSSGAADGSGPITVTVHLAGGAAAAAAAAAAASSAGAAAPTTEATVWATAAAPASPKRPRPERRLGRPPDARVEYPYFSRCKYFMILIVSLIYMSFRH